MKISTLFAAAAFAAAVFTATPPSLADQWNLPPITGHAPAVWGDKPNWLWSGGNPLTDNGATWTVSAQLDKDPQLTSPYTPMAQAVAWGYYYVWALGAKQQKIYWNMSLLTAPDDGTVQSSPSSVITFQPPAPGTFTVDIAGTVSVQQPTAGHSHATVYTLAKDASSAKELLSVDLADAKSKTIWNMPSNLSFHSTVTIKKDEQFAVRIQTVNPGNASAGHTSLDLTQFSIKSADGAK